MEKETETQFGKIIICQQSGNVSANFDTEANTS